MRRLHYWTQLPSALAMQADAIIAAMKGCAVLHVAYVEGEPIYWLSESNGLASVPISATEGKAVAASPLVTACGITGTRQQRRRT
jgi:hypothetical protein